MKGNLLTAAALTVLAATGYAQTSVSVYGLIDSGIQYSNNANPKQDSLVRLSSGAMNTSRIGLRGSEDLGSGLKAVFRLEGGFKADSGEFDAPGQAVRPSGQPRSGRRLRRYRRRSFVLHHV